MAHEPKKRHSRERQGKRRHAITLELKSVSKCSNCGSTVEPHTVCGTCGYYKGQKVVNL